VTRYLKQARLPAGILALVVGLTFVAPPAFAGEALAATHSQPLAASAAAKVNAMPAAALAQAPQAKPATAPAETSKPFFKTGKGAAVAVLLAASLAMTFVAFSKDRVKSPAK